jgi:hypothetical protein
MLAKQFFPIEMSSMLLKSQNKNVKNFVYNIVPPPPHTLVGRDRATNGLTVGQSPGLGQVGET